MADNIHRIVVEADSSKAIAEMKKLSDAMKEYGLVADKTTNRATMSMTTAFGKLGSKLSSIGTSMSVGITAPLTILGKALFDSATNLETITTSFEVFTGSIDTAKNLLQQLKDVALKSPLQFQDVTKASQTLLGYGLSAEQTMYSIRMLGDISGGNAEKLQRLALAFGQVNAAGRLMGQEARQMINAGFNPLQAIADKTGKSMAQLTKEMKDGKISVQEVADAFEYATQPGGRFFDMMGKQSETLRGQYNKLSESVSFAMAEIGTSIANSLEVQKFFSYLGSLITTLKDKFLALSDETKGNIAKFAAFLVVMGPAALIIGGTITSIVKLVETFTILRRAIILLEASTGIGAVIAIIGLLGGAALLAADKMMKLGDAIDDTALRANQAQNTFKVTSIIDDIEKVKGQIRSLQKNKIDPSQGIFTVAEGEKKLKGLFDELANLERIYKKVTNVKFNATPTGEGETEMTKAERKQYEKLVEQAKIGYTNIHKQMRTGYETKLDIFDRYAKEELDKFKQFNIDTSRIEYAQYKMRQEIAKTELGKLSEIVNKNSSLSGLKANLSKLASHQAEKISAIISPMDKSLSGGWLGDFNEFFKSDIGKFNDTINKFVNSDNISKIGTYTQSMASALQDFGVNMYVGFADIAGSALSGILTFGDAISKIQSMFLNLVGDLLIQMGTSAIKLGLSAETIKAALEAIGLPGGGFAAIAAGTLAVAAGSLLKGLASKRDSSVSAKSDVNSVSVKNGNASGMATGSTYSYGGSSYSTQSLRLSIDLTGAITATQTGYQINKSLETTLRVTGR